MKKGSKAADGLSTRALSVALEMGVTLDASLVTVGQFDQDVRKPIPRVRDWLGLMPAV